MSFIKLNNYYVRVDRIVAVEEMEKIYTVHLDLGKHVTVKIKSDGEQAIDLKVAIGLP